MIKKYWETTKNWLNDNNVEICWFLIGSTFANLLMSIGKGDLKDIFFNSIVIVLLYATRKIEL